MAPAGQNPFAKAQVIRSPREVIVESIFTIGPVAWMFVAYLAAWIYPPGWFGDNWLHVGPSVALLEFFLLHSGPFVLLMPLVFPEGGKKLIAVYVVLLLIYGVFVVPISISEKSPYLLIVFTSVTWGRIRQARDGNFGLVPLIRSFFAIPIVLGLAIFAQLVGFPKLGFAEYQETAYEMKRANQMIETAEGAVQLTGVLTFYFLFMTCYEIFGFRYALRCAREGRRPAQLDDHPVADQLSITSGSFHLAPLTPDRSNRERRFPGPSPGSRGTSISRCARRSIPLLSRD